MHFALKKCRWCAPSINSNKESIIKFVQLQGLDFVFTHSTPNPAQVSFATIAATSYLTLVCTTIPLNHVKKGPCYLVAFLFVFATAPDGMTCLLN